MDSQEQGGEEVHHTTPKPKNSFAKREEEILAFWQKEHIFEKSLKKASPKGEYVFYDGPPFASGLPHYGHILASTIKDAIPRYRTMRGYHVPRRWGWDCHGLPVENLVEKEMGFKGKRDIEAFGIANFNEKARTSIMKDVAGWKRIIPRIGRWVDMEHDYRTMDPSYTESVWWAFKNLYDRGLIYEGFKALHLCPRCGTTLSNNEVSLGYQDIEDIAVTVKLPLVDEPNTAILIWTTTPWTLPANSAAAINPNIAYGKVKRGDEFFIVALECVQKLFGDDVQVEPVDAKQLLGKQYTPPFPYFTGSLHKHKMHAFKIYPAAYVTAQDGTGIVHLAPAFGAEDLLLAQKEKIPLIHHVTEEGKFTAEVVDFAGLPVKPKGHHMETDQKIVAYLSAHGLLFAQEKIKHSYPHCWRCDTPLLNWAGHSWFVNVSAVKQKLLRENKKVSWVPEYVGKSRFNNGLESAPDWAISRSRYWGAPIPVWRNTKTKEIKVAGSIKELLSLVRRSGNRYFVMRHGEADHNVSGLINSDNTNPSHLTETGKQQVRATLHALSRQVQFDYIVTSPITRAQETARIAQEIFHVPDAAVMIDERITEVQTGSFNGRSITEWRAAVSRENYFDATRVPEGAETAFAIRRRVGALLFDVERRYTGKIILFVTHGDPACFMNDVVEHVSIADEKKQGSALWYPEVSKAKELSFVAFPHNDDFELDLHRPYIDEVPLGNSLEGHWKRIPDVFDCWFESGSMPFASNHYPSRTETFNPKKCFGLMPKGYPADFIAEGLDQTRGWFYSLLVLGSTLFNRSPYKNVIVNGLILAENGQKMSKRLKNYPDPLELIEMYGVDAMRYYLLSSSVIRAEDLRFSARSVEEVLRKLLMRLDNVRSFYELYANDTKRSTDSSNLLDQWILSRLSEIVRDSTNGFETYQLDLAVRPIGAFIDDLSTWYIRRSRARFKNKGAETTEALGTLRYVLYTLSHILAPTMPFFAEYLFGCVKEEGDAESVHLSSWPERSVVSEAILKDMAEVRILSSRGLEARERAGIKIRQPLALLTARSLPTAVPFHGIIAEEVNVKEIRMDASQAEEVLLDTLLTPALQEEGWLRECVRAIQDLRKQQGFAIADRPALSIATNEEGMAFLKKIEPTLITETGIARIATVHGGEAHAELPFPFTGTLTHV